MKTIFAMFDALFTNTGETVLLLLRGLGRTHTLGRGWRRFAVQLNRLGVESVPLVLMIGVFTGMVVALQTGIVLKQNFGAVSYVATIVGLSLVREMGPVITAFILAGRVGSAMAAELGTMAVNEEINALRAMGISPVSYLYVPRLFAMVIMQPLLTVYSVLIGILGGGLIASTYLNFPFQVYLNQTFESIEVKDIFDGFSKTVVFALIIVSISCRMGMTTRRGAEGVGRSTTTAVVASLTMILISDYLMTRFLN